VSALPQPAPRGPGGSLSTVALLRVDARLREAVPEDERPFAQRVLVVPHRELADGPWDPAALVGDSARPFAAVVLRGLITQDITLAGRCNSDLLGPGDVFRPWRSAETSLPCEVAWTAGGGAAIAVLDERFLAAARRWPDLSAVLYDRLAEQLELARARAALVGLPRVEQRILALFWQLADRWGVVRPHGVDVELSLTHELIGHLVGAQRPTVSLALQALAAMDLLRRDARGVWTLDHASHSVLGAKASDRLPAACPARPRAASAMDGGAPLQNAVAADGGRRTDIA
jgi:CRP/FNR family transcriptional regulator, cyclic AMP receptor protein